MRLSGAFGSYIGMADLSPFSRLATWRSGYAADCKSVYAGSIPAVASTRSEFGVHARKVQQLRKKIRDVATQIHSSLPFSVTGGIVESFIRLCLISHDG